MKKITKHKIKRREVLTILISSKVDTNIALTNFLLRNEVLYLRCDSISAVHTKNKGSSKIV